jgi:hypothetical protein
MFTLRYLDAGADATKVGILGTRINRFPQVNSHGRLRILTPDT